MIDTNNINRAGSYKGSDTVLATDFQQAGQVSGIQKSTSVNSRINKFDSRIAAINREISLSDVEKSGNWISKAYNDNAEYQAVIEGGGKIRYYRGSSVPFLQSKIKSYLPSDFSGVPPNSIKLVKIEAVDITLEQKHDYFPYVPQSSAEIDSALSGYSYLKLLDYKKQYDLVDSVFAKAVVAHNERKAEKNYDKALIKYNAAKDLYNRAKTGFKGMLISKFEGAKYYDLARDKIKKIDLYLSQLKAPVKPRVKAKPKPIIAKKPVQDIKNMRIKEADDLLSLLRKKYYGKAYPEALNIADKLIKGYPGTFYDLWAKYYKATIYILYPDRHREAIAIFVKTEFAALKLKPKITNKKIKKQLWDISEMCKFQCGCRLLPKFED